MSNVGDLRGHGLAEREFFLPVCSPVDKVLEDRDDDEEVGETLDQTDLSHASVVEDGRPPVGQAIHKHSVVDLALLLVFEGLVHGHQMPELDLCVRGVTLEGE